MSRCLPRSILAALAATTLAAALPARADPLLVQSSGVFTAQTPLTPFSAPGAAWSMSFVVDRHPVPSESIFPGELFAVPFQNFQMLVDGVAIAQPVRMHFFSDAAGGGMNLVFGTIAPDGGYTDSLGSYGAAFYSGSEAAPTIVPGTYATFNPDYSGLYVTYGNADYFWQPDSVFTISAVPLPGSAALMLCGLAALALRRGAGHSSGKPT